MDTRKAGKKGGDKTLRLHGADQLKEWGKLGGRPKKNKTTISCAHKIKTIVYSQTGQKAQQCLSCKALIS